MMPDLAINLLLEQLRQLPRDESCVWFADENSLAALTEIAQAHPRIALCTNRYDIHTQALKEGISCTFNDAQLSEAAPHPIQHLFIRISKEKPITHHTINQAAQILASDGLLHLAGLKGEGIKTYIKKTQSLFTANPTNKKNRDAHYGAFSRPNSGAATLDTQNYDELRPIGSINNLTLLSKPGVFGFEKIDEGSSLLLETTHAYLQDHNIQPRTLLDLGCGYGLLTLGSMHWSNTHHTATDNNAAALIAIAANAKQNKVDIDIIAADAGAEITATFDCVLCNPPFHQGFSVSGDLTDKFLKQASQKLTTNGYAFFVVNSFIGLEKKARIHFKKQETLINTKKFKVLMLSH